MIRKPPAHSHGFKRRWRGLAAVELVLVLPLVLLLLLACGELGHAIYQYNALTKAVRNGAAYTAHAALMTSTGVMNLTAAKITTARNLVVFGNPAGSGTPILPGLAVGNVSVIVLDSTHVKVSASYTYVPIFASIPAFDLGKKRLSSPVTLSSASSMRAL